MGKVAFTIKITPESPETDLEAMKKQLQEKLEKFGEIKQLNEEPIGFGMKKLVVLLVYPEEQGGTQQIEKTVEEIKGISNIETDTTLL